MTEKGEHWMVMLKMCSNTPTVIPVLFVPISNQRVLVVYPMSVGPTTRDDFVGNSYNL